MSNALSVESRILKSIQSLIKVPFFFSYRINTVPKFPEQATTRNISYYLLSKTASPDGTLATWPWLSTSRLGYRKSDHAWLRFKTLKEASLIEVLSINLLFFKCCIITKEYIYIRIENIPAIMITSCCIDCYYYKRKLLTGCTV